MESLMATLKLFVGFECPNLGGENVAGGSLDSPGAIAITNNKKLDRIFSVTNGGNVDLRTAAEFASFAFAYIVSDQVGTITLAAAGILIPLTPNVPFILGASSAAVGTINFINGTTTANVRGLFLS